MSSEIKLIIKRNTMGGSGRFDAETAEQQLFQLLDERLIGKDNHKKHVAGVPAIIAVNTLIEYGNVMKREQRQTLRELFGEDKL